MYDYDQPESGFTFSENKMVLQLEYPTETEIGKYECKVKSDDEILFEMHHLLGRSPEVKQKKIEDLIVLEGDTVTLNCDIVGNPSPNKTWYKVSIFQMRVVAF